MPLNSASNKESTVGADASVEALKAGSVLYDMKLYDMKLYDMKLYYLALISITLCKKIDRDRC